MNTRIGGGFIHETKGSSRSGFSLGSGSGSASFTPGTTHIDLQDHRPGSTSPGSRGNNGYGADWAGSDTISFVLSMDPTVHEPFDWDNDGE